MTGAELAPTAPVVLMVRGASVTVAPEDVHFAFGSGRLSYDCVKCGAKCCRGYGYSLRPSELALQIRSRPLLRVFLETAPEHPTANRDVFNCPPACFFLASDSKCGIHSDHGYHAKPETCRLFPFNKLRRVGQYLIVTPPDGICPLSVLSPGQQSPHSRHEDLLRELQTAVIGVEAPECVTFLDNPSAVLLHEREIIRLGEDYGHSVCYGDFFQAQLAAAAAAFPEHDDLSGRPDLVGAIASILDVPSAALDPSDATLTGLTVAITPFIRSIALFRAKTLHRLDILDAGRAARFAMAAHALASLAKATGMVDITFSTVAGLVRRFEPLLWILTYFDSAMTWHPSARLELAFPRGGDWQRRFVRIVKALLPARQRRAGRTLQSVLEEASGLDELEYLTFLNAVAQRLHGQIVRIEDYRVDEHLGRQFRPAVQRWALGFFGEDLLVATSVRRKV